MNRNHIPPKRHAILVVCLGTLGSMLLWSQAATLNVTNFGASGDCRDVYVRVTTNSAVIVTTNVFTSADVGKVVQLFGAGYYATLKGPGQGGYFNGNYSNTPTNHQDLVARIVSIGDGTHIVLDRVCGVTASDLRMTYGTDNRTAFTRCIDAAGSNDVIYIPAGNYQLVEPKALDTNFIQTIYYDAHPTITLSKGGLTFLGDGTNATILTGMGAWQQKGYDSGYRGYLFQLRNGNAGPTNDGPLIFNHLQFNGNATRNHATNYTFWPTVPTDGSGWDGTHHAVVDSFSIIGNSYKSFTNCLFTRWHGETIAGIAGGTNAFVDIGNCWFVDGNSTVINYNYRHDFHDNLVADYYQVAEDGQFLAGTGTSYIRNNVFTNIYGTAAIALVGASTNWTSPGYMISSNKFYLARGYGVMTAGIKNVAIIGNEFHNSGILFGAAGSQGTYWNSDFVVAFNTFNNAQVPVMFAGAGKNRVEDVLVVSNSASLPAGASFFGAASQGAGAWFTNVVFRHNTANKGLWSTWATGQYFVDDPSNDLPFRTVTGASNVVSYAWGARHNIAAILSGSVYHLDYSKPAQIPPSAILLVTNSGVAATLYRSASLLNPIAMSNGYSAAFRWTNGVWRSVPLSPRITSATSP